MPTYTVATHNFSRLKVVGAYSFKEGEKSTTYCCARLFLAAVSSLLLLSRLRRREGMMLKGL